MNFRLLISLLLFPTVAFAQSFLAQFPYRTQTTYFDFRYERNSAQAASMAPFADAFIKLVNRDFLKFDFDYPIRVVVLEDRAGFKNFLTSQLQIDDPPNYGIYLPTYKLFATFEDSGWGTFTHEILHPLVESDLKNRPPWAKEGIPTFFEKFYGYWKDGKLVVYWGYQNPWRIAQIGDKLTHLDLPTIISDPDQSTRFSAVERNESDLRMASVFLWQQGRFKRFLKLIAAHDKRGYASYFEAALDKPMAQILPLWQLYLDDGAQRRAKILTLPPSTICPDEAAFQNFAQTHDISLEQPAQSE